MAANDVRVMINKKILEDIAKAIRWQRGEADFYRPSEMPEKIMTIEAGMNINLADIFNHGNVSGLNPYYWFYNGYRCDDSTSKTNTKWTFNYLTLYRNLAFAVPVDLAVYKKLKVTLSISNQQDQYKDMLFGLRKKSRGFPGSSYDSANPDLRFQIIGWNGQYNIVGHSPWYELPKQTLTFNIGQFLSTERYPLLEIYTHSSDVTIYEMWLEP